MKAYKVFNPDWTCKDFQYEVGKIYEIKEKPVLCEKGFHACKKAVDCFKYYNFNPNNKVAEVELLGEIVGKETDKQATNKIKILREIKWSELLNIVNSGDRNSGYRNSGNYNSGNYNSGDSNSGYRNSGDRNSGNYNSGNLHTGLFNSKNAEKCYIFNKLLDITELKTVKNSNGYKILNNFKLIKYRIRSSTGKYGDYKYCSYKQSWKIFFSKLTAKQKLEIKRIPHFDSKVFEEITGVKL